jgi:LysM repeat protein
LPDDEDINTAFTSDLSVELFPSCAIDLSILDEPLATISYQESKREFGYDFSRVEDITRRVERLKSECTQIIIAENILKEYEALLKEAEIFKNTEDYILAISSFQKAANIFPEKGYAKDQILAINVLVKRNNDYNQLITNGDLKYAQGKLNDALFDYYKAKNLKPKAIYPQEQINAIDRILTAQNAEVQYYQSQLQIADSLFILKLWEASIDQFIKVIDLKKDEKYPQNKLVEAEKLFAIQNELDASYQAVIDEGDTYFEKQSFSKARTAYLKANRIKPDEQYPLYKIEDINTIVEQKDIRKTNTRYRELVVSADKLFSEKAYHVSLTQYTQASNLKPNEIYPPQQIDKIDQIIKAQRELEVKYQLYIKSADSAFYLDKFRFARGEYVVAREIKPTEDYPSQQIAIIDQIFTDQIQLEVKYQQYIQSADSAFNLDELSFARELYVRAKELKPIEEYPIIQINKIDILLSDLNEFERKYQAAIAKADSNFAETHYDSAKVTYQFSLTLKPAEEYPRRKIEEIDALLNQLSALEDAYQKAINQGDQNLALEQYLFALSYYEAALEIKKNEEYPRSKIEDIESILAKLEQHNMDYNQALAKADDFYKDKQYEDALPFYKEALVIKPNEKYPPDQINRINSILVEQLAFEKTYKDALDEGDKYFIEVKYQLAISSYQKANHLKPNEEYPRNQITKIRVLLGANVKEYDAYIKMGDDAYRIAIFQDAIMAYENALGIFPNEAYPKMMLDKIDAKIRRESVVSLVLTPEVVKSGQEKRYSFEAIDYRDRQDNYILIELRNNSDARVRVFINFGKDGVKNGGYIVNLLQRDAFTKYFVRIDRRLRWLNEDNNWISLLPEGGDLEVNRIQISREEKSN